MSVNVVWDALVRAYAVLTSGKAAFTVVSYQGISLGGVAGREAQLVACSIVLLRKTGARRSRCRGATNLSRYSALRQPGTMKNLSVKRLPCLPGGAATMSTHAAPLVQAQVL